MTKQTKPRHAFAFVAITLCFIATGCTGLSVPRFGDSGPDYVGIETAGLVMDGSVSERNYHAVRQAVQRNAVVLNVQGDSDPVRVLPLPDEGQGVLVSDLLRQSGVLKKIGSVDVVVYRHVPPSPTGLRLPVKMNAGHNDVRPESDYALRPGDRVQVSKHTSDMLQSLLGKTLGL